MLVLWQTVSLGYPPVILPSPLETLYALARIVGAGTVWEPLGTSSLRFLEGFALAFFAGSGLGLWVGRNEQIYERIRPFIAMLQSIPPISLILLAILWFGVQGGAQLFVMTTALLPVFFYSSAEGVRQLPKELLEMAAVFKISLLRRCTGIILPALGPYIAPAVSVSIGNGWKTIVMSELISGHTGIGAVMNTARLYLKTDEVMAWTLLVASIGMTLERLFLRYRHTAGKAKTEQKEAAGHAVRERDTE